MLHSNTKLAATGFESSVELASMVREGGGLGREEGGEKKIWMISIKGNFFLVQYSKCNYMETATERIGPLKVPVKEFIS